MESLSRLPVAEEASCARIDHHRMLRTGLPEAIFGAGKNAEQLGKSSLEAETGDSTAATPRGRGQGPGQYAAAGQSWD